MSARDQLHAAIDRLPDDRLGELLDHAHRLEEAPAPKPQVPADGLSLMAALRAIKVNDLPPDFSENLHEYLHGEKGRRPDVP